MEPFNHRITVTPPVGADKDATGFITDASKEISDQLIAAGWTPPGEMPRPPWMKPSDRFSSNRPAQAMDVDPEDFYGIADAIHQALEMLDGHEDAGTDWSPLDPKCSRRLRQALMAAWVLEYPKEAEALDVKLPYPPPPKA